MGQYANSIIVVLLFVIFIFYYSQIKFKHKMLCYFIRPNRTRIKKWVPLHSTYVVFDRGRYGIGQYECDSECIVLEWYDGGVNKVFPTLVPTLEFKWDTPNPRNPKTGESTWHTPEARYAAWQEHQHIAFSKAAAAQGGAKRNKFLELLPIITIGLVVIMMFLMYQSNSDLSKRLYDIQSIIINAAAKK